MPDCECGPDAVVCMCDGTTDCRLSPRGGRAREGKSGFFQASFARGERRLNVTLVYRRCAGMDVHQKSITVCARTRVARDRFHTETAVFGTFTQGLKEMARWLRERSIRHVAMESAGVYWKPVWNVLEASRPKFEMVLVDP